MKPIEVSSQDPQLQPPPPSGDKSIPPAGIVESQQSGRNRLQLVTFPFDRSHMVTLPERKIKAPVVVA